MGKIVISDWRKPAIKPITLLFGAEEFFASRALKHLKQVHLSNDAQLEIHQLDAADYSAGQLLTLSSPSLFSEPRLIVISGAEKCSDAFIEDVISYESQPTEDTFVVITHNGSSVRGKKFLEALRSSDFATEIVCLPLKREQDKVQFVLDEFKILGRQITQGAARALSEAFSEDVAELSAACNQLQLDSADVVDETIVEKYYGGRVETTVFKVVDAAMAGNAGEALALLRHMLASGADPVPIVAGISVKIRQAAKILNNGYANAQALHMEQWKIDRVRKELVGWTEFGMANLVSQIAAADAASKGAERDPKFALEKLVLSISKKGEL